MSTARSGQVTVVTAGTAVQGPATPAGNVWQIAADSTNTGIVYIGDDGSGTVSASSGYALKPGDRPLIVQVPTLSALSFNASANGDKVCWFRLS